MARAVLRRRFLADQHISNGLTRESLRCELLLAAAQLGRHLERCAEEHRDRRVRQVQLTDECRVRRLAGHDPERGSGRQEVRHGRVDELDHGQFSVRVSEVVFLAARTLPDPGREVQQPHRCEGPEADDVAGHVLTTHRTGRTFPAVVGDGHVPLDDRSRVRDGQAPGWPRAQGERLGEPCIFRDRHRGAEGGALRNLAHCIKYGGRYSVARVILWTTVSGGVVTKRNLTVQLDEDVIQQAKVLAARRGTSVSTLVAAELSRDEWIRLKETAPR